MKSMKAVRCASGRGGKFEKFVRRPVAATPEDLRGKPIVVARPAWVDDRWALIHVPTGYSVGRAYFVREDDAFAALRDVLAIPVDWSGVTLESAEKCGTSEHEILAIAKRHGGCDLAGVRL